jgi:hypothetical protein
MRLCGPARWEGDAGGALAWSTLRAMTPAQLKDYRRQLESAIAYFSRQHPVPPIHADPQATIAMMRHGSPMQAPATGYLAAVTTELDRRPRDPASAP